MRRAAYDEKLAGVIDADILNQIRDLEAQASRITDVDTDYRDLADKWLELPNLLTQSWIRANTENKKRLLFIFTSNLKIIDGNALIELHPVFAEGQKIKETIKTRK